MPRNWMMRVESRIDKYRRLLEQYYGFSPKGAALFAWNAAANRIPWNQKAFRKLKRLRRKAVMERYRDLGGEKKRPNFVHDDIGAEAVRLESIEFSRNGFSGDKIEHWYDMYYYGFIVTPEARREINAMAKSFQRTGRVNLGGINFIKPLPKRRRGEAGWSML